ncbi:small auxin-up RNA [Artemisia annua]|uniref:Small auxin-up RNA n=1 Tax=Artemisia annua TaxID=35608 RepID=A0A2U1PXG5_ARTAN|nr:small auxin-up RNA [Artemisia annua]
MESFKDKNNFLSKTWKRCRSFSHSHSTKGGVSGLHKSKSWSGNEMMKKKMAPEGFFPVYVGPEKQRFTIKTKYASHPLFSLLLEDAESEYGTHSDGPILLPCDVAMFYKVLAEMKAKDEQPHGSCSPFSPSRRLRMINSVDRMGRRYKSYEALMPSSLIKMN